MAKKESVIIKRDSRKNWEKSRYIPKENVIVIMDNEDGSVSLMIGDGETAVNQLPDVLKKKAAPDASVDEEGILVL